MAYLAPVTAMQFQPVQPAAMLALSPGPAAEPDFSPLEWSIIRLSRGDRLWTIRSPGPLRRVTNWLIGRSTNPALANERLEALRRIAVLSWHYGFAVAGEDVADFLSAGFTLDQYELLVTNVRRAVGSKVRVFATGAHA